MYFLSFYGCIIIHIPMNFGMILAYYITKKHVLHFFKMWTPFRARGFNVLKITKKNWHFYLVFQLLFRTEATVFDVKTSTIHQKIAKIATFNKHYLGFDYKPTSTQLKRAFLIKIWNFLQVGLVAIPPWRKGLSKNSYTSYMKNLDRKITYTLVKRIYMLGRKYISAEFISCVF